MPYTKGGNKDSYPLNFKCPWFKTELLSVQGIWIIIWILIRSNYNNHSSHVQKSHNTSVVERSKHSKNSTLNNKNKKIDLLKNGKQFLGPSVQSISVQSSRVQASSRLKSKAPVVLSPSIQNPRVKPSRVQASRPCVRSPAFRVCIDMLHIQLIDMIGLAC